MITTLKLKLLNAWRSRTIWAAALLSLVGVIETQVQLLAAYLPQHAYAHVMVFCGVVMGFFRLITNEAVESLGKLANAPNSDGTGNGTGTSTQPDNGVHGGAVNSGESGQP